MYTKLHRTALDNYLMYYLNMSSHWKPRCFFAGFFTPFIYLPHHSMSFGVSYFKATFLVSLIGAFNTVGRVGAGWLADRSWADGLVIQNSALIVAGLASMVMPFIANYIVLAILASVFGLCVGKDLGRIWAKIMLLTYCLYI